MGLPQNAVTSSLPRLKCVCPRRYIEVVDEKMTGEVLLDEALKMMKVSERMSIGSWVDLMSGASMFCVSVFKVKHRSLNDINRWYSC